MTDAAAAQPSVASPPRAAASRDRPAQKNYRDWILWVGTVAFVGLAWLASRYGGYKPGSDVGYWLGLVGGVAMLFTLLYPLRKRVRALTAGQAGADDLDLHEVTNAGVSSTARSA